RHVVPWAQPQVGEARRSAIARRGRQHALPLEARVGEVPARLELDRGAAQSDRQWQRFGEVRERRKLDRVRRGYAALGAPGELELDRLERRSALRRQLELAHL